MPRSDLIALAQRGDGDAFSLLASEALGRLYPLAGLILRDPDQAQDAVQEALTDAWRYLRGLRDPERFDAWLDRLVVRACHRQVRRERRHRVVKVRLEPSEESGQAVAAATGPDDQARLADRDELERAFRRLSVDQRAVIVVCHYLDLPLAEAAVVLDIPMGTVKSRLSRAKAALRASLDAEGRPEPMMESLR